MTKIFHGRTIIPGDVEGEALVTRTGFNTLASFHLSLIRNTEVAICSDHNNRDIYGKTLTGKILCAPKTIGSTSAGATWENAAFNKITPKAVLLSDGIDSLGAAGLIMADHWANNKIITIDRLGDIFLKVINSGNILRVKRNGTVILT